MRSTTLKTVLIILSVLFVLFVASELIVPRVAASYVKREIRKRYPAVTGLSVSVKAFPALRLAFKQYGRLHVKAGNIALQGVDFDSISLDSPGWPGATFEAVIGPGEISRFFSLASSYLQEPEVRLEGDALRITGSVDTGDSNVEVDATGTLRALNGRNVFFEPREVRAGGVRVTSVGLDTVKQVMSGTPIFTVREDLPFSITGITVKGGMLKISGNVNLEKALNIRL